MSSGSIERVLQRHSAALRCESVSVVDQCAGQSRLSRRLASRAGRRLEPAQHQEELPDDFSFNCCLNR
jgi:hypothetical protein